MATGFLMIQARTANDALPLPGVSVKILDAQNQLLYDLITDANGQTETVSLPTVEKNLSLQPDYEGSPYTAYRAIAQADGFQTLYVSGINIFDGITAVQPAPLTPMGERQQTPGRTEIVIGKPAIQQNDPWNQEGPVVEPLILRQVVIPNPITVHLGRPSSAAANVQVSFPDYVKNVASSEIYPTWPAASLTANIYAIITFALNRVFTEWYRSQGYPFDITNSTSYDQYFVYGRTIYDSISRIVDQIFHQYVRREGHNVPYFTSFCNGTTATCRGLSQWGTVNLAQQGLDPLQILRYYYPDDVEIATADAVTDVLVSYPGTVLRPGSSGLDVQTIQTYLNRIRQNYPAIPAITDPEGTFGNSTLAAVKKFQSVFGLTPDGLVGPATWNKISYIYAAVSRLADLESEGTSLGIGTVPPSSVLRLGSRGQDVLTLQAILSLISEFYPSVPRLAQNGIFDTQTQQAVIAFQQLMRLNPDGIVGPATWSALYDTYLGILENTPSAPDSGTIEYTVQPGDTLWLLSRRFGTTVDAIKALNNLTSDMLYIGQKLLIPADGATPSFSYTVQPGDTLWLLSRRFNTTVDAIKALNGLTSDLLSIGQVLQIPES
ncbi:MAG TPA: LysM peptidoglycan-binding domain-containing protein [Candidatus Eisenbergiella pullicola]|nr:LysM peptidoglycan-binding domain-containing protein [Candidatus Eisenbergiella pullicola]